MAAKIGGLKLFIKKRKRKKKNWLLVKLFIAMCSVRFGGLSRSDFYEHKLTGRFVFCHIDASVWQKDNCFQSSRDGGGEVV